MRDYEITNKINSLRGDCSAEQMELVDGMLKLTDDLDSITMESIKILLPEKFSDICMSNMDDEDVKVMMILMKFMSIYKGSVDLTRLSAVVSAQQSAQLKGIDRKLDDLSKKISYMDTKLDRILKEKKENK